MLFLALSLIPLPLLLPFLLPSFPFELWCPFLQERLRPFPHVFCSASHAKQRRLHEQSFFLWHFYAALDRFNGKFNGRRIVRYSFFLHRSCFCIQSSRFMT